jgi:hypothetical protein
VPLVHDPEEEFLITTTNYRYLNDLQASILLLKIGSGLHTSFLRIFCEFIAFLAQVVLWLCGAWLQPFTLACIMNCDILLRLSSRLRKHVQ